MKTYLYLLSLSAVAFISCRNIGTQPPEPNPIVKDLTPLEKTVVASDNSFGFELFARLNESAQNQNVFISPFSVSMALGMALDGADGATLDSMKQALGQSGLTMQEINGSYKDIRSFLTNLDPNVTMNIANSVWSRNGFPILASFLSDCQTYFDAEATSLDFSSPDAVQTINNWVNTKTNGKIPTIIDQIPSEVVLYLINAIYFKGTWTYQFDPANTTDTTFASPAGSTPCKLMTMHARFAYRETGAEQVVDLPYGAGQFSMTVILPSSGTSIDQYAASLTQEKWDALMNNLDSASIDLSLPKFNLEYEKTLNDELSALGMGVAFTDDADFSRISPIPLKISEVKHKTYVEVNEEGTEAAAVTFVGFIPTAVISPSGMRIDHPFIVAIREHATGTILFLGKIVSPPDTQQ